MERRLIPLNGLLALLSADGGWFDDLAQQGFRLHALEIEVESTPSVVRADAVIYRVDPDLILLCECKSGRNVEERQARGYSAAGIRGLRSRSSVPSALVGRDVRVEPLFVALEEHRDEIAESLRAAGVTAPILEIGPGVARLAGDLPAGLASFDRVDRRAGFPPVRVRLDRESDEQEFLEVLVQHVEAAKARRESFLDLDALCASIFPGYWPSFGVRARRELRDRLRQAAAALQAGEMGRTIRLEGGIEVPPRIVILETPATADPRGAPQAWQGEQRRAAKDLGRSGPPITERRTQLSFDDLASQEVSDDEDDPRNESGSEPVTE
jgi:hypothetical protein